MHLQDSSVSASSTSQHVEQWLRSSSSASTHFPQQTDSTLGRGQGGGRHGPGRGPLSSPLCSLASRQSLAGDHVSGHMQGQLHSDQSLGGGQASRHTQAQLHSDRQSLTPTTPMLQPRLLHASSAPQQPLGLPPTPIRPRVVDVHSGGSWNRWGVNVYAHKESQSGPDAHMGSLTH